VGFVSPAPIYYPSSQSHFPITLYLFLCYAPAIFPRPIPLPTYWILEGGNRGSSLLIYIFGERPLISSLVPLLSRPTLPSTCKKPGKKSCSQPMTFSIMRFSGPFRVAMWVISQTFKEPRKPLYRPSPASSLSRDSLL
jgi:hypothetical protein